MAKRKSNTGRGVLAAIGLLILTKLKWVLALLKFSKLGGMLVSLIVSLGTYALIFGWQFAVAIIYLLFIHEMGHLVAARRKGIKTTPAIFIPFMGAVIGMKEQPKNAATEAYLAYGGPLAGLISVIPALILYEFTGQPIWALVIMLGSLINLFNLFPVSPLDGGRIVGVLSPNLWLLGLIGLAIYTYFFPSVLLIIIIILGVFSWWGRLREDYSMKLLQLEIEERESLITKIVKLKDELFYQYYREDEGPMVNQVMKDFLVRDLHNQRRALDDKIKGMKKWYIPFLQDRLKLQKQRLMYQRGLNHELSQMIYRINVGEDIPLLISEQQHMIQKLEKQRIKINKYYDAPKRTKWVVFIAYLVLAGILGLMYIYGQSLLDSHQFITSIS